MNCINYGTELRKSTKGIIIVKNIVQILNDAIRRQQNINAKQYMKQKQYEREKQIHRERYKGTMGTFIGDL